MVVDPRRGNPVAVVSRLPPKHTRLTGRRSVDTGRALARPPSSGVPADRRPVSPAHPLRQRDLATSASEVFGEAMAQLCPRYPVSILAPTRRLEMFDFYASGGAAIRALPSLSSETSLDHDSAVRAPSTTIYRPYRTSPASATVCLQLRFLSLTWDCDDSVEIVSDAHGRLLYFHSRLRGSASFQ